MAHTLAAMAAAQDVTVIPAHRALGVVADLRGNREEALNYFIRASKLSRRDRPTQLWLIAFHDRQMDEAAFVKQFDVALRTSQSSLDELLPLLVSATAEPKLLPPLREVLAENPPWALTFTTQLISFGPDLETVTSLVRGRLNPADDYQRSLIESLIGRLVSAREFDLAWRTFTDAVPGASSTGVRSGDFESETAFAPFGWELLEEEELFALRGVPPDRDSYALLLTAFNGRAGTVARQLLRLKSGPHRLRGDAGDIPAETFARPRIRISCANGKEGELLSEVTPTAGAPAKRFSSQFRVPDGCNWQWLTIDLAGPGMEPERSPWIDNLVVSGN